MNARIFGSPKALLGLAVPLTAAGALTVAPAGAATIAFVPLPAVHGETVAVSRSVRCDRRAAIDGIPFFEMPQIAREQKATGTSLIRIDVAADGTARHASLFRSSGNRWLDGAALQSARLTRYAPELRNCKAIAGSYLLSVEFTEGDLG